MNKRISSGKIRKRTSDGLKYMVCAVLLCFVIGPILITLFASFKLKGDMVMTSPLMLPKLSNITLTNYKEVLENKMLGYAFRNSAAIVAFSLVFNIGLGSVTAYILERFEFRFRRLIFALFFMGMLIPAFITEIARFKVIQGLGLYNTLGAPIVIYIASDLMQLYIYRQFISKLPVSLDESALIDGCSYFSLFGRIIFPLLTPATATISIIKSVTIINDMYIPYLYMPNNKLKTLTTFLMTYAGAKQGSWQNLSAAIIIIMIPAAIIYIIFQKHILSGITAGAVKE